jgi:hypothetical protein
MRIAFAFLLAVLLGFSIAAAASYHSMYARLGGYAGVHSISTDLLNRLSADPKLSDYFANVTPAQRAELATYAADVACKEAGAHCKPIQPDISLVKNTPPITGSAKQAAISDLKQTLASHHVPADIQFAILQAAR